MTIFGWDNIKQAENYTLNRAVVAWAETGEPITLTVYGPNGEVAVPLLPKRVRGDAAFASPEGNVGLRLRITG